MLHKIGEKVAFVEEDAIVTGTIVQSAAPDDSADWVIADRGYPAQTKITRKRYEWQLMHVQESTR